MDSEPQKFQEVQVDQNWISKSCCEKPLVDYGLLICMICYGIPLGQIAQCSQCERIFCERDFQQVVSTFNTCPNCKKSPFKKKTKPHILYTSVFQKITFQCQLCLKKDQEEQMQVDQKIKQNKKMQGNKGQIKQDTKQKQFERINFQNQDQKCNEQQNEQKEKKEVKQYSKNELANHIKEVHKTKVMDYNMLYDFEVVFEKGNDKIVFDFYQNIELNLRLMEYHNKKLTNAKYPYQLDDGNILVIDLQSSKVSSPTLQRTGKLVRIESKQLKKGVEYEVWQIGLDIDFKFYSKQIQELIKGQYVEFKKNKKKNEFTFDMKQQRYRISFNRMKQINTYTEFERNIRKSEVKFP